MKSHIAVILSTFLLSLSTNAAVPVISSIANTSSAAGVTYTVTPILSAGAGVHWSKEFGPDDMTVDPTTGAVSWAIPANLPREAFHLGVRATNADGSAYITWILKVGGGNYVYVGPSETYKTISAGTAAMASGDTLVIRDGIYTGDANTMANPGCGRGTLPPAGSAGIYTTAMAEHPGGVLMDGQGARPVIYVNGNYTARNPDGFTRCTGGHQYIAFKGIIAANPGDNGAGEGCITTNHASHIKIVDCGAYDAGESTTPISINRSEYVLAEGNYVWGNGRMMIAFYICDYSIMRRNVARMDRSTAVDPIGIFDVYSCQHTRVQNNIAIDSDQWAYYRNYTNAAGAFIDQSGSSNGEDWSRHLDNSFDSNIALNVHNRLTLTQGRDDSDPVTFNNMVGWAMNAIPNGSSETEGAVQITSPDNMNINQCTFGGWRSPHFKLATASGTTQSQTVSGWDRTQNITNSIFYDFKDFDNSLAGLFQDIENADFNNIFGVGTLDTKTDAPSVITHTITTNPTIACLKYLPRIEAGCPLQTAGLSGARVGANILNMRGKSGTLWGETGFDTPTATPMWPFPHENLIKAKMAAYSYDGGRLAGARGFCAGTSIDGSPQTLTKYIWEYLGNPIPAEIYHATPDTIPPVVSAFTLPATASSLIVPVITFTATDNAGITGFLITQSSAPPSPSGQGWSSAVPTSVRASAQGNITFYPWTKDAAGNVSAVFGSPRTVLISDTTPPVLSSGVPSGTLAHGTTSATLGVATDENATCKYSTTAGVAYASMASTFTTTGSTSHSTSVGGLMGGQTYIYYVRCRDASANANISDYTISFSISNSLTMGETTVLSGSDNGNGNLLLAQSATLSQTATIQSLSFYVLTASGNLRLGIYDATGPSGGPGVLRAQTNSITPTTGWNTANVITPVQLAVGTYWLAYLPSSSTLSFPVTSSGAYKAYSYAFSSLPATFSTNPTLTGTAHWSFYATLSASGAPPADTTAPNVTAFTLPATASSLTISVSALTATDNVGVTGYCVTFINSSSGCAWSGSAPSSVTFTAAGSQTAYVWAKDAAGNISASRNASVTITLPDTTAPTLSITSPVSGAKVKDTVTIGVAASDNIGVTRVEFYLDGRLLGSDTTSPYSYSWNTTSVASGVHALTARAFDASGNSTTSSAIAITVRRAPRAPAITGLR